MKIKFIEKKKKKRYNKNHRRKIIVEREDNFIQTWMEHVGILGTFVLGIALYLIFSEPRESFSRIIALLATLFVYFIFHFSVISKKLDKIEREVKQ